ncbi:replication-associated protein [Blackfly multicomponent virus 2]|nr:replication-associated protein [Blackfly multicomponent virus 2]
MTCQKKRDFCWTINNPTPLDDDNVLALKSHASVRYLIVGQEKGEEGTPHLQGYVYFKNQVQFSFLKKLLPRAHIEACRGTPDHNIAYCSKEGSFFEHGDRPISQKRKGELGKEYWEEQLGLAKAGRVDECDAKLQISHFNALHAIAARYAPMPPDNDDIINEWYYGDTGTGKSLKARTDNPGFYLKMCNKWWDGYLGEESVLIEDFDKNHHVLGHHLKIWADRYAFPAEVKGSKVNLRPKKIVVTSNWHPKEIWPDDLQTLDPILRRFRVIHMSTPFMSNKNTDSQ